MNRLLRFVSVALLCLPALANAAAVTSVTPTSLTFASQAVGTTSAAQTITVSNTGTTSLTVSAVSVSNAAYKLTNNCTRSVSAGKNCTIAVAFAPTAAGTVTATVSITSTGSATPKTVALSGTAVAATVTGSVTPASLTFASTAVGGTSAAQVVTVRNTGTGNLTVSGVTISGTNAAAFAQTNTCTGALVASASCTVSVTFKPTASGSASATLSIASNATGSPFTVALSGTGAAATTSYTLTPTALTFASQAVGTASAVQNIVFKNTGTAALIVSSATLSGTAAGSFSLTNGCTASVAANATCTLGISFTPSAAGAASATLTVIAGGVTQTASLAGTGTAAAAGLRPLPSVYSSGKAIAYGPYRAGGPGVGEIPTDAQILEDLGQFQLAGYNLIRLFGADTVSTNILRLIAANYPTMSVQLGIYLAAPAANCTSAANSAQITTATTLATTYTQVVAVSVGNEPSLANNIPVSCLVGYVQQVRNAVTQPVTADDTAAYYAGKMAMKPDTVLPYLDFVSIHSYPILNSASWDWMQLATPTGPGRATAMMNAALTFAKNETAAVRAYPFTPTGGAKTTIGAALPVVMGETGWKAAWTNPASAIELYTATPINAKAYLDLLNGWKGTAGAPTTIFYFDGFDEAWKGTDDGWGLWDATRAPRYALCGVLAAAPVCNTPDVYIGIGYYP